MTQQSISPNRRALVWRLALTAVLIAVTAALAPGQAPARALWPPLVALAVIVLTRHALTGLLLGSFAGAILLQAGDPWTAYLSLFSAHLVPSLQSSWKTGALAFTLILGGFAAVLEAGGGFTALLRRHPLPAPRMPAVPRGVKP